MGTWKSKKNLKSNQKKRKINKKYLTNTERNQSFGFLRLMDMLLSLQSEITFIKNQGELNYGYGGYSYVLEERFDKIATILEDIFLEIESQLDYDVSKEEIKSVIGGIYKVIIKNLEKEDARDWKNWEKDALYQSTYQPNLNSIFDYYPQTIPTTKKEKPTTTTYVTKYVNRPKKKLKFDLIVTEEVSLFIKQMMVLNKGVEWGVAFTWTIDKELKKIIIDRVYIMPVDTGGAHVQFINESEYRIFNNISELGEFVTDIDHETRFAGIMHSHHTMGSWHSSIDHGTIASYINDFRSVLSIVWAWGGTTKDMTADVILQNKKDAYTIDSIFFKNDLNLKDPILLKLDNKWTSQYNDMINIVEKDFDNYKKLIKRFESTGKFIKIEELYKIINKEDVNEDIQLVKDLIL